MSGDPLDRDRFPDRPDHPDFWRLSSAVLAIDAHACEDGMTVPEIVGDLVDIDVLEYFARHRTGTAMALLRLPALLAPALQAIWVDAFVAGAQFGKDA